MKYEFRIFKKGITTAGKVTIFSKPGEPFDKKEKIKKYLNLGYKVYDMNNKEIKK